VKAAKELGLIHPSMAMGRGVSLMDILFVAKASGFVVCMSGLHSGMSKCLWAPPN
jgi:hypothetical protein